MSVPRHRRRGFTLLEVLATIAFAAIVLPSVVHAMSVGLAASLQARRAAEAAALAHGKLCELAASSDLQHAGMTGDFGTDSDYKWSARLQDWEGSTLRELDVTVAWPTSRGQQELTISTLVYSGVAQ